MSEEKDTAPSEFSLESPPLSREEERKAKKRQYDKAWREANKEAESARDKVYREANKEAVAARLKAWREKNKEAIAAKSKARREANKEAEAARQKAYREANKEAYAAKQKAYELKRKYGLTIEQRDAMSEAQDNRCLCCNTKFGLLKKLRPSVDHCHATGRVRGILCNQCNTLLGKANDQPAILRTCARYLEKQRSATRDRRADVTCQQNLAGPTRR